MTQVQPEATDTRPDRNTSPWSPPAGATRPGTTRSWLVPYGHA
jgi:hypothetical protein